MSLKDRCPILYFPDLGDERGKLVVVEGNEQDTTKTIKDKPCIPFEIKRVFYIYGSDSTVVRGQHANRESEFVLINVAGESKVRITDGYEELIVILDKPMMGVYIPKMIWKDMYGFSSDSVLLVLASTHYDDKEYIRKYDDYLSFSKIEHECALANKNASIPLLSLCMPTNGVSEWVFESLNSIYKQNVDTSLYEVIIMDNGSNVLFQEEIAEYIKTHKNLKYYHTDKPLFLSEPEAYKKASGELIKFINHRNVMRDGSIMYFIEYAKKYKESRPVIYFTNGVTRQGTEKKIYNTFGEFIVALEYYSSWSSGMTIWKKDLEMMGEYTDYNYLFPHTDILFYKKDAKEYVIDGSVLWDEIPQGQKSKGNYNVFYAFAIEYPSIVLDLLRKREITSTEYLIFKKNNLNFLTELFIQYILRKDYCCYDLTGYDIDLEIFYSVKEIYKNIIPLYCRKAMHRIMRVLKRDK